MRCLAAYFCSVVWVLLASCDDKTTIPARHVAIADEYVPVVGQLDKNGKLVILYLGGSGYAVLETDYDLVFFNEGDEATPI